MSLEIQLAEEILLQRQNLKTNLEQKFKEMEGLENVIMDLKDQISGKRKKHFFSNNLVEFQF